MRKFLLSMLAFAMLAFFVSCKKSAIPETTESRLTAEETQMIADAGFNENWAEKTADGKYLIEGDILLTAAQLQEMIGSVPTNNILIAEEEHYRTYNLVSTSKYATITVSLEGNFPGHYSQGLDMALDHYNKLNLAIKFQRVSSKGNIVIKGANLSSRRGCVLGQSAGFPDSQGNPATGFTLSTSSCATSYISTAKAADEVMAHEIGHCIGFRHTDYKKRSSCGPGPGEKEGSIGAVHIDGTPTNVSGSYNSWMMACVNGDNSFSNDDNTALKTVY